MNKSENISELVEAITKVMSQVRGMEKNSKVGTGRSAYDGTKDQDVKEAFNSALSENGLVMMPVKVTPTVRVDRFEALDYNKNKVQKQSVFTEVSCEYILAHTSGQYMQIAGYGHGVDPQDKGAGKATTYALVEHGCIEDDNDNFIKSTYFDGDEIDRKNPRVEVVIIEGTK